MPNPVNFRMTVKPYYERLLEAVAKVSQLTGVLRKNLKKFPQCSFGSDGTTHQGVIGADALHLNKCVSSDNSVSTLLELSMEETESVSVEHATS